MRIDFNEMKEATLPGMNNGTGEMTAKMYMGPHGKIIPCQIHAGDVYKRQASCSSPPFVFILHTKILSIDPYTNSLYD